MIIELLAKIECYLFIYVFICMYSLLYSGEEYERRLQEEEDNHRRLQKKREIVLKNSEIR